jgi:4'-phosphopantetheinyl transferase
MIRIGENEIHVWQESLCVLNEELQGLWSILSQDERQRLDRFHFTRFREKSLVSRAFLRKILGQYLQLPPERLGFCYNLFGKPALIGVSEKEGIYFNVTHSGDRFLCAVARNRDIGIDIEQLRHIRSESLIESIFSPMEKTTYNLLSQEFKQKAFFLCWVRKEALLKAWGLGLSYPLYRLSVTIVPGELPRLTGSEMTTIDNSEWQLFDIVADTNHVAALAFSGQNANISYYQWQDINGLDKAKEKDNIY